MTIQIRNAQHSDVPGIMALMNEFAEFEKLGEWFQIKEDKLSGVLFGPDAFVNCLVAVDGETLVAYAIFYPVFSTFRGQKGMFLEDLFITAEYRRDGLGERLLREVARAARQLGCERIDFVVLDWNTPAIAFYEKHGADTHDEERHFMFTDEAFARLSL